MIVADLMRRVRSRLDDENPAKYLWSRQDLLDYLNDTIRDAAIRASLTVQDGAAIPFAQNADLTWKDKYALPNGTTQVDAVYLQSQPSVTLQRTSFRQKREYAQTRPNSTQKSTPYQYALDQTQPGTGEDRGIQVRAITFIGAPTKADTAMLDITRLPTLVQYDEDVPEMDEMWHPDLVVGVTGLAYLKKDTDTFDPTRSVRDLQLFEDRFGPRISATVMRERQIDVPLEMHIG